MNRLVSSSFRFPGLPAAAALTLLATLMLPAAASAQAEPPEWFTHHLNYMVEGGTWTADNKAHKSEAEPFDAYGQEWSWGLAEKTARFRILVMQEGKTIGAVWEHHVVWHPGEEKAYVYVYGTDGTHGIGTIRSTGEGKYETEETFYAPDGSTRTAGHRLEEMGENEIKIESFQVQEDGTWKPERSYVWKAGK